MDEQNLEAVGSWNYQSSTSTSNSGYLTETEGRGRGLRVLVFRAWDSECSSLG